MFTWPLDGDDSLVRGGVTRPGVTNGDPEAGVLTGVLLAVLLPELTSPKRACTLGLRIAPPGPVESSSSEDMWKMLSLGVRL